MDRMKSVANTKAKQQINKERKKKKTRKGGWESNCCCQSTNGRFPFLELGLGLGL